MGKQEGRGLMLADTLQREREKERKKSKERELRTQQLIQTQTKLDPVQANYGFMHSCRSEPRWTREQLNLNLNISIFEMDFLHNLNWLFEHLWLDALLNAKPNSHLSIDLYCFDMENKCSMIWWFPQVFFFVNYIFLLIKLIIDIQQHLFQGVRSSHRLLANPSHHCTVSNLHSFGWLTVLCSFLHSDLVLLQNKKLY